MDNKLSAVCYAAATLVREDFVVNEDYEKLFPSKEIEKPENKQRRVACTIV